MAVSTCCLYSCFILRATLGGANQLLLQECWVTSHPVLLLTRNSTISPSVCGFLQSALVQAVARMCFIWGPSKFFPWGEGAGAQSKNTQCFSGLARMWCSPTDLSVSAATSTFMDAECALPTKGSIGSEFSLSVSSYR